jgi:tRNA(Ile)-lysidine synthase
VLHLQQQIRAAVQKHRLLKPRQRLLVAVSGGIDSMVLLHVLASLAPEHGWDLTVAHLNHQLRGVSSLADERLVRRTAKAMRLPIVVSRANVRAWAKKHRLSLEMAAREIRHEFLVRTALRRHISQIALAHHQDDQLEHFFLRFLRGSGGQGLAGMKWLGPSPSNPNVSLIRPLLDCPKEDIREYASNLGLRFREDASNASLDIQRNRIRHELLPLLRRRYQPGLAKSILRVMSIVGAESDFVTCEAESWLRRQANGAVSAPDRMKRPGQAHRRKPQDFPFDEFEQLPVALQRRIIQLQLIQQGITPDFDLVEHLRQYPEKPVEVSMASVKPTVRSPGLSPTRAGPETSMLRLVRDSALIVRQVPRLEFGHGFRKIDLSQPGRLDWRRVRFDWRTEDSAGELRLKQKPGVEFFDADAVGLGAIIRHWQPGDRFQPIGMKSAAKLQDLFVNQKLSRDERRRCLLATTASGEIYWVEGLRISERFKLTRRTIRRLHWAWQRL